MSSLICFREMLSHTTVKCWWEIKERTERVAGMDFNGHSERECECELMHKNPKTRKKKGRRRWRRRTKSSRCHQCVVDYLELCFCGGCRYCCCCCCSYFMIMIMLLLFSVCCRSTPWKRVSEWGKLCERVVSKEIKGWFLFMVGWIAGGGYFAHSIKMLR